MFNAAAAFGGGLLVQKKLESVTLPTLRRVDDNGQTFKLSVRILAASINGFNSPGTLAKREQPYVEVTLNSNTKTSEYGDFVGSSSSHQVAELQDCPWRFSDTITFTSSLQDVIGPGVRFRLAFKRDVVFGPLVFALSPSEIGEGSIDLKRVLTKCVLEKQAWGDGGSEWATPVIPLPFNHVKDGVCGTATTIGQAVAHVAAIFSVDDDPDKILKATSAKNDRTSSLAHSISESFSESFHQGLEKVREPVSAPVLNMASVLQQQLEPVDVADASIRARKRADVTPISETCLESPDLDPKGWQCRCGPNGQFYWHHAALGAAPWDSDTPRNGVPPLASPGQAGNHVISAAFAAFQEKKAAFREKVENIQV